MTHALDWANILVGAISGAALGVLGWFLKRVCESWILSKDLPYPIGGIWFSAEYDSKGGVPHNTITKVKVRRGLGGTFRIKVVKQLSETESQPPTAWIFNGKLVHGDTLVGIWRSTVEQTKRLGTASIKFIEYGRAVGYWNGPAGKDYPVYGYWIMSRAEDDLGKLCDLVLRETSFDCVDVAGLVLSQSPPS